MEEKTTPPAVKPTHAPAMDVVAPHNPAPASLAVAVEPEPLTKDAETNDKPAPAIARKDAKQEKPKKPAAPKQPGSGAGMAIFATMVIVLGLAALATYAYLKTQ